MVLRCPKPSKLGVPRSSPLSTFLKCLSHGPNKPARRYSCVCGGNANGKVIVLKHHVTFLWSLASEWFEKWSLKANLNCEEWFENSSLYSNFGAVSFKGFSHLRPWHHDGFASKIQGELCNQVFHSARFGFGTVTYDMITVLKTSLARALVYHETLQLRTLLTGLRQSIDKLEAESCCNTLPPGRGCCKLFASFKTLVSGAQMGSLPPNESQPAAMNLRNKRFTPTPTAKSCIQKPVNLRRQ